MESRRRMSVKRISANELRRSFRLGNFCNFHRYAMRSKLILIFSIHWGSFKIYQLKSASRCGKSCMSDKEREAWKSSSYLMSYVCKAHEGWMGRQEKEWFTSVKHVYFIPSYIFSHMIVHMLRILNGCVEISWFILGVPVRIYPRKYRLAESHISNRVCGGGKRGGGEKKKSNDNEPKSMPTASPRTYADRIQQTRTHREQKTKRC